MSKQKIIYLILLALAIILSMTGWLILKGVLFNGSATIGIAIVSSVFLLLGVVLGLMVVLFDSMGFLVLAPTVSVATSFLFFEIKPIYFLIFIVGIGLFVFAIIRSKREKKMRMTVFPIRIAKPALGAIFTFLALIIASIVYFSPPAQEIKVEIKVPRPLFDFVLDSTTSITPSGLFSIDQILNQETEETLYQSINDQINFFVQPYKKFLPYGLALAVFLSLKAVSIIFVWIALVIIQGFFIMMKKLNLINIKKEMVEKEVVEII